MLLQGSSTFDQRVDRSCGLYLVGRDSCIRLVVGSGSLPDRSITLGFENEVCRHESADFGIVLLADMAIVALCRSIRATWGRDRASGMAIG